MNVLEKLRSHVEYHQLVQQIKACQDAQELDQKKKIFTAAKAAVKQMYTGATKSAQKVTGHVDNKARAVTREKNAEKSKLEREEVKDHVCKS